MPRIKGSGKKKSPIDLEERQPEAETRTNAEETAKAAEAPFAENPEATKKVKDRISIQLTEDGKLDTESMRAATLAKVREFFQDPENQKLLGATPGVKADELISESDVAMLFDLIGTCEGWAFTLIGKIEPDIATKHAMWSEKEKVMVVGPAQRVIVKNAAQMQAFLRWKDEIVLAVIVLAISRAKFDLARKEQKDRNDYRRASGAGRVDVNPEDFRSMTEQKQ
jgi:hypothetical protein